MGYLKKVGTTFIYIGAVLALITFIPGLPPYAKFEEYSIVEPKELKGDLATNERLNNAEILFQGEVKGPEAFASYNGELYTGVHGGYVVKVTKNKLIPIVKFGKECDGHWQESKCGRPLGLKFDKKGALYVCDAYYGVYKVNVQTGKYERLVNKADPIEGKKPKVINFLDVASNGDIYWTDSSTEFELEDGVYSMIANPSGRLIKYNAATKKNQVLLKDLGFANGVALSEDEQFVIVAETLLSRIIKYNLKGPKAGQKEIFIEGLPGLPDNIHSDNKNGFLVSLVIYADSQNPELSQSLMPHPFIRRMAARSLALLEAPFKCLQTYYPNYYAERIVHYLGHFESAMHVPSKVAILRIDNKGNIIDAAYNTDDKITGISSAYIHDGYLWLGSPFVENISRVPLKQAFPDLLTQGKPVQKIASTVETEKKNIPNASKQEIPTTTPKPTTTTSKSTTTTTQSPKSPESKSTKSGTKASSNEQKSSQTEKSSSKN